LLFHNDLSRITKSKSKSQNGFDILAISGIDIDTAYRYKLQNKICIRDPVPAARWSLYHPTPISRYTMFWFGIWLLRICMWLGY
jgi:hypothetical protein